MVGQLAIPPFGAVGEARMFKPLNFSRLFWLTKSEAGLNGQGQPIFPSLNPSIVFYQATFDSKQIDRFVEGKVHTNKPIVLQMNI